MVTHRRGKLRLPSAKTYLSNSFDFLKVRKRGLRYRLSFSDLNLVFDGRTSSSTLGGAKTIGK